VSSPLPGRARPGEGENVRTSVYARCMGKGSKLAGRVAA
jgi:hypothetical protein